MPLLAWIAALPLACWAPELLPPGEGPSLPGDPGVVFVEGGLILPEEAEADGQRLTEGRVLLERAWTPNEEVELSTGGQRVRARAPATPTCALLFRVGLGDVAPTALGLSGEVLTVTRPGRDPMAVGAWQGEPRDWPSDAGEALAPTELSSSCPTESPTAAYSLPQGRRLVLEGPFTERSGETTWRLALFR